MPAVTVLFFPPLFPSSAMECWQALKLKEQQGSHQQSKEEKGGCVLLQIRFGPFIWFAADVIC